MDIGHFTRIEHQIDTGDALPTREGIRRTSGGRKSSGSKGDAGRGGDCRKEEDGQEDGMPIAQCVARGAGICFDMQRNICHGSGIPRLQSSR